MGFLSSLGDHAGFIVAAYLVTFVAMFVGMFIQSRSSDG